MFALRFCDLRIESDIKNAQIERWYLSRILLSLHIVLIWSQICAVRMRKMRSAATSWSPSALVAHLRCRRFPLHQLRCQLSDNEIAAIKLQGAGRFLWKVGAYSKFSFMSSAYSKCSKNWMEKRNEFSYDWYLVIVIQYGIITTSLSIYCSITSPFTVDFDYSIF